ncbi:MAG: VOC family protein [Gammaproteobacteria bacterium]|nr:VOC family protein [Gammaproteobacteria bacterium]
MIIPPGFATITVYFIVRDAARFIEFLEDGLGGEEVLRSMRGTTIANAQVRIGNTTVMVAEKSQQYPAMCGAFYLYVDNAVTAMERALNHGAQLEMEVSDMSYGDRQGGVRDEWGNVWWISQRLVDEPYSV